MMKKETIIEILKELDNRELSEWMIALINAWFMDKDTYQNTLFMIWNAIKQLPNWEKKKNLQNKLDSIKASEKK